MNITTIIGARPQFIKAAFLSSQLERFGITERLLHTGQHFDENMSQVFFNELGIPSPAENFGVNGKSHGAMTGDMLLKIEQDLQSNRPDAVLVYGDTDSTLAGALAAAKLHIPIIHIEAGLRSYDRKMPEEINRVLTDHVSSLLLCPTETSVSNLQAEGIQDGVYLVGDVMQHVLESLRPIAQRDSSILDSLGVANSGYLLATIHRAENTNDVYRLKSILNALSLMPEKVVIPLHPRTRALLDSHKLVVDSEKILLIEPQPYLDIIALISSASLVLTDSGGIQKEAAWLQTPCVTLRDSTEWVETVESGWNILAGFDQDKIVQCANDFLNSGSPASRFISESVEIESWVEILKSVKK